MESKAKTLNPRQFVSLCLGLTRRTSEIIHEVRAGGDLKKHMKGENDPVTQADFKSQYIISTGINRVWPDLNIVGEEVCHKLIETPFDFAAVKIDLPELPQLAAFDRELDVKDLAVYVDPLDGTKAFVEGGLGDVTTLVGLAYKSKPLLGVIVHIWSGASITEIEPVAYVGIVDHPEVFAIDLKGVNQYALKQVYPAFEGHPADRTWKLAVSVNHYDPEVENLLKLFSGVEKLRVTGMGKKYLQMVRRELDGLVQNLGGCGYWDILAGTAVLEAVGGYSTGVRGEYYTFNGSQTETTVQHGVFALVDKAQHANYIKKFQEYYKSKGNSVSHHPHEDKHSHNKEHAHGH